MCPGHISHDGELVRESLVNAEMENVRQIQVRAHALIEEDGLECARLWKCGQGRCAGRGNQGNTAEFRIAFEGMIDLGAIADTDAAILKAPLFSFTLLPIFEQSAYGETERPIVAGNLRHAIAASGNESGAVISGTRRRDDPGNDVRWHALR